MTRQYEAGAKISEYVLEACIGQGTFGEVWRARHHVWDTELVAVKLPTEPEYVRFLQREGVMVHGLRHPNIIRVRGLDPYGETPYLIMELVEGPSLRTVLDEHSKGLDLDVVLVVMRGLLRGLGAAHAAHVIHRDLKPGNVLLHLQDRPLAELTVDNVKIGDFGLGVGNADTLRSLVMQSASIERDEQSTAIAGTLAYMAPELRDTLQQPTPRADLYSLGVMFFEMLTGERPAGAELPSTLRADVPARLDEVFRGLYARFDRRYETAEAVLEDLEKCSDSWRDQDNLVQPPPVPEKRELAQCPQCKAPVEVDDQFCTLCGRQLVARVPRCPSCGGFPGPRDRFCIFCGAAVSPIQE